jgi:hypothetical protein
MAKVVDDLKTWFEKLSREEKVEVVTFLYEGKALLREGMYVGPRPNLVLNTRGLHVGPAPSASASVCPSCGRPY